MAAATLNYANQQATSLASIMSPERCLSSPCGFSSTTGWKRDRQQSKHRLKRRRICFLPRFTLHSVAHGEHTAVHAEGSYVMLFMRSSMWLASLDHRNMVCVCVYLTYDTWIVEWLECVLLFSPPPPVFPVRWCQVMADIYTQQVLISNVGIQGGEDGLGGSGLLKPKEVGYCLCLY